jgi:hypothetical protein
MHFIPIHCLPCTTMCVHCTAMPCTALACHALKNFPKRRDPYKSGVPFLFEFSSSFIFSMSKPPGTYRHGDSSDESPTRKHQKHHRSRPSRPGRDARYSMLILRIDATTIPHLPKPTTTYDNGGSSDESAARKNMHRQQAKPSRPGRDKRRFIRCHSPSF